VGVNFSPDGSTLYVVNASSKTVTAITVATQAITATITLWTTNAYAVPGQNIAIFTDATDNVWGIVPAAGPFPLANAPTQVAVILLSGTLTTPTIYYVTTGESGPDAVAVTPIGATAYVCNYLAKTVSVLDLTALPSSAPTVTPTTIPTAGTPYWIQINPNGTTAYVSSLNLTPLVTGEGPYITVLTLSSNTVTATITDTLIGPAAGGFSRNGAVYVSATTTLDSFYGGDKLAQVAIITVGSGAVGNTIPVTGVCAGAAVTAGIT
jgi:YVTN family beta-propeller protein